MESVYFLNRQRNLNILNYDFGHVLRSFMEILFETNPLEKQNKQNQLPLPLQKWSILSRFSHHKRPKVVRSS